MALTFRYLAKTTIPVEVEGLTPAALRGKSMAEIERFEIWHGKESLPLAEMFQVTGTLDDGRFDLEGDLSGVHWIGAHLTEGEIHVHGSAGRHVGSQMQGGRIVVDGAAGDYLGSEMQGGRIEVRADAGDLVGAAYRGSARGMTGGTILVGGNAGNEVGLALRRGLIAIGGDAGEMAGANMIAGTLLLFGKCGQRPGAQMRRGTIGLLGEQPTELLPTFRFACRTQPTVLPLLLEHLNKIGFRFDRSVAAAPVDLYHGDMLALGRGEIFLRPAAA